MLELDFSNFGLLKYLTGIIEKYYYSATTNKQKRYLDN